MSNLNLYINDIDNYAD